MEKPHKKLDVWKLSMELVKRIYEITGYFPQHEDFGSLSELDTQLDIAYDLKYIKEADRQDLDKIMVRIDKMLSGLIASKKKEQPGDGRR